MAQLKNIPLVLTFSNKEDIDYFYRSDFNIYDERYWKLLLSYKN